MIPKIIKNSKLLRMPFLCIMKAMLSPLKTRSKTIGRLVFDAYPGEYIVTGNKEKYIVSTQDKGAGILLFQKGEVEFGKLIIAMQLLRAINYSPTPRHIIDVGANLGIISIPAIKRGLMQTATAIEPHPENIKLLTANVFLNEVSDRIEIRQQAVGSKKTEILYLKENTSDSSMHSIGHSGIKVASTRIDDIEPPRADALLWMDIEGYEGHALKGASRLLESGIPVVCEFNPRFLHDSGGMDFFKEALSGRRIYDLKHGVNAVETNLDALSKAYAEHPKFTDILAVAPRTQKRHDSIAVSHHPNTSQATATVPGHRQRITSRA